MTRFDSASRKPKSIARLIAEEAFSRPVQKPAAHVPVVRVVSRKLSLKAPEAPVEPAAPADEAAHKPRVFVIRKKDEEAPAAAAPVAPMAHPAEAQPVRTRRRRVVAPVHVVYSAPERPPQPEPAVPASLDLLAGSLAGLEPTLEMIRRAMAFDFSDPAIVAEWEELSRTAGQLSELIAA